MILWKKHIHLLACLSFFDRFVPKYVNILSNQITKEGRLTVCIEVLFINGPRMLMTQCHLVHGGTYTKADTSGRVIPCGLSQSQMKQQNAFLLEQRITAQANHIQQVF